MGTADSNMHGVDIVSLRKGTQLNNEQRKMLVSPIVDKELLDAIKSIGVLTAPDIDGFGSKFFSVLASG